MKLLDFFYAHIVLNENGLILLPSLSYVVRKFVSFRYQIRVLFLLCQFLGHIL